MAERKSTPRTPAHLAEIVSSYLYGAAIEERHGNAAGDDDGEFIIYTGLRRTRVSDPDFGDVVSDDDSLPLEPLP